MISTTPPSKKRALHNASAIRQEMGSIYREMRAGKIAPTDGTRFIYVLDVLRKAYETEMKENLLNPQTITKPQEKEFTGMELIAELKRRGLPTQMLEE